MACASGFRLGDAESLRDVPRALRGAAPVVKVSSRLRSNADLRHGNRHSIAHRDWEE